MCVNVNDGVALRDPLRVQVIYMALAVEANSAGAHRNQVNKTLFGGGTTAARLGARALEALELLLEDLIWSWIVSSRGQLSCANL